MIRMYEKVTHTSGRTAVALRAQTDSWLWDEPIVWVAWDDAASYPRLVGVSELTSNGLGAQEDVVIYDHSRPERHGRRVGDVPQLAAPGYAYGRTKGDRYKAC